jgi:hypothetical protein
MQNGLASMVFASNWISIPYLAHRTASTIVVGLAASTCQYTHPIEVWKELNVFSLLQLERCYGHCERTTHSECYSHSYGNYQSTRVQTRSIVQYCERSIVRTIRTLRPLCPSLLTSIILALQQSVLKLFANSITKPIRLCAILLAMALARVPS